MYFNYAQAKSVIHAARYFYAGVSIPRDFQVPPFKRQGALRDIFKPFHVT